MKELLADAGIWITLSIIFILLPYMFFLWKHKWNENNKKEFDIILALPVDKGTILAYSKDGTEVCVLSCVQDGKDYRHRVRLVNNSEKKDKLDKIFGW